MAYVRGRGLANDAEDLAQEVFLRLFRGGVLERADANRGRFRSLLLAVTKHVIADHVRKEKAVKRGGRADVRPLGELDVPADPGPAEASFEREWLLNLLTQSLERLRHDHPNYHEAVTRFLLEGRSRGRVAQLMGRSEASVRNWIHRGRRKLISYLREEAWSYTSSEGEYTEELGALGRLLAEASP